MKTGRRFTLIVLIVTSLTITFVLFLLSPESNYRNHVLNDNHDVNNHNMANDYFASEDDNDDDGDNERIEKKNNLQHRPHRLDFDLLGVIELPDEELLYHPQPVGLTFHKKQFFLSQQPLRILSGSIHYFRILPQQWKDRLLKLKACGLNTVET